MKKIYPPHIYEKIRREVAEMYARHELRKLFPGIRTKTMWKKLDAEVGNWFDQSKNLCPVRDFWNGVHGISTGFKLKNIVYWLTSKNFQVKKINMPIDDIAFQSNIAFLDQFDHKPSAKEVINFIFDKKQKKLLNATKKSLRYHSKLSINRDADPIIVIERNKVKGVVDGNRRLLRAVVNGEKKILAYFLENTNPPELVDNWVPTQILMELNSLHRYQYKNMENLTTNIAQTIYALIKDTSVGKYELENRVINTKIPANKILFEKITQLLNKK